MLIAVAHRLVTSLQVLFAIVQRIQLSVDQRFTLTDAILEPVQFLPPLLLLPLPIFAGFHHLLFALENGQYRYELVRAHLSILQQRRLVVPTLSCHCALVCA